MEWIDFARFLGRRKTLVILVFLLAWLSVLDLIWFVPTRSGLRTSASELSLQVAESAHSNITAELNNIIGRVQNATLDIQAEPERTDKVLARLVERNAPFRYVVITDRNGTVLTHAGALLPGEQEKDYSKLSGIYLALAGSPNFSDVTTDNSGSPISYVSIPIRDASSTVSRVLITKVNLKSLGTIIQSLTKGGWQVYITDKNGVEIIGNDLTVSDGRHNVLDRPIVQKVAVDGRVADGLAADDGYINDEGIEVFAVGEPIAVANWSLFVERPRGDALRQETTVTLLAIMIFALGTLSIFVGLWSYWRLEILNERLGTQEKELEEKNAQLQELDKIKSDFISVAAHQLRTPLSALKWVLGILKDEGSQNLTAEQRSLIFKGAESNERMVKLINEMLVVTRIESGKERFAFVPLHMEDIIENTMIDFAGQAHVRRINLNFDKPLERLGYISADAQKIRDVMQNLIENAMRYTMDGGTITVRAVREESMVHVSITDTGIGIPDAQKPNIFNKFFRADNAVKLVTDGSGLGLFIAKAIVEKHSGTLSFESAVGKGTVFHMRLPMSTPEESKDAR